MLVLWDHERPGAEAPPPARRRLVVFVIWPRLRGHASSIPVDDQGAEDNTITVHKADRKYTQWPLRGPIYANVAPMLCSRLPALLSEQRTRHLQLSYSS
ncbi:hypothetical protein EYF80_052902 [Liparis tanakae]|uniref:Uncharacterized protein n=1 Tax=Liparis tanakae TaxID=230148 RepID=A0A4Z2F729_9TELE|nr:hypothetical protein EYF80_052902 [Liparis tanakae]